MRPTATKGLVAAGATAAALLATIAPAQAAPADKAQVLASFTQTSASSFNTWAAAESNRGAWSAYAFNWSTDYCSSSPDNPFGFPFQKSCQRHDFGYRNYKEMGTFDANKSRLDSAFYEDLKRVCNGYSGATKTSCNSTAWVYYQAVRAFG
ncbi:phospholipase [Streptomyces phytophilus]|uniref:phospholipase n=1 Tax=Streptomyces phytophilus TaxID=722715 RepID=UPI0015F0D993|nr:phospholipase [Streptomyces phytophilus]